MIILSLIIEAFFLTTYLLSNFKVILLKAFNLRIRMCLFLKSITTLILLKPNIHWHLTAKSI